MLLKYLGNIHPNLWLGEGADHCLKPKFETSTHESISCSKCFKELLQKYSASVHPICTAKIHNFVNGKIWSLL